MNKIQLDKSWVYTGSELKPKNGATSSNTWVVSGDVVKPKNGATSSNSYDANGHPILVIAGQLVLRLW